jgi:hypothetical protein
MEMKTLKKFFEIWMDARTAYVKARLERGYIIY